jgi:hypothetical protein
MITAPGTALGMGFYGLPGPTLREQAARSKFVVYGILDNPRQGPNGEGTDFVIASVIKSHPIVRGKNGFVVPRYIEVEDRNRPARYLVFCDIVKGRIDPYQGELVEPAVADYLRGMLAIDGKDVTRRVRYCFDFLHHANQGIANDALRALTMVPARELGLVACKLPAAKLRRWLRDPKATSQQQNLYGFLLGHCGTANDALALRALVARRVKEESSAFDGILAGYVLLEPEVGWAYGRVLLSNPANGFSIRYAVLRAVRRIRSARPDLIEKPALIAAMKSALDQEDIADLIIDVLRECRCWNLTSRILPLYSKLFPDATQTKHIRRAILRYALQCPDGEATAFISERCKTDSMAVRKVEATRPIRHASQWRRRKTDARAVGELDVNLREEVKGR